MKQTGADVLPKKQINRDSRERKESYDVTSRILIGYTRSYNSAGREKKSFSRSAERQQNATATDSRFSISNFVSVREYRSAENLR